MPVYCRILAMIKRPFRGESASNAAHKRQAVIPQDEENTLPSSSSSLAHQASSLSIPTIPPHLIADLILPFVADRATWNSVCSASNDLRLAGKKMTPPWPNKSFNNLGHSVPHVAFSPSGSQLAFCVNNDNTGQAVVHIWDRWGNETLLEGHTESMHCLEYSLDGEHLASGSEDGSIRIWHTESFHPTASHPHMERATKTPRQVDTILGGSITSKIIALSFSRTDTNALASGGSNGEIKVWNVNEQACIHSFHPGRDRIRSLFFAGGAESTCIALTHAMSVIRLWKAEGRPLLAKRTIVGKADRGGNALGAALSPTGSFVAASFFSRTGNGNESTLALYDLETMTKTQSVVMPGFTATHIAVSPDSKQVVVGDDEGRIRILQTDDFSIQRDMDTTGEAKAVCSVAFDPTCRVLAFGYSDGGLELRRI